MAESGSNPMRAPVAAILAAAVLALGLVVWLSRPERRGQGVGDDVAGADAVPGHSRPLGIRSRPAAESTEGTAARTRTEESSVSEEGADGPQFPLVDQILANGALSNEAAASRLLAIAQDGTLPLLEREEALAHGLNLDFPGLIGLVDDPQLPQPLAQRFFDEMLNHNEHRDLQVKTCVALLDHENESIREESAHQLAFYIGLEERADKPDELKQEASAFLEDLARRPPRNPDPVDPDADIPETAPINPLEERPAGEEADGDS